MNAAELEFHAEKWRQVSGELNVAQPNSAAAAWVSAYVFGLKHAQAMLSKAKDPTTERQAQGMARRN